MITDKTGIITYANKAFFDETGYTKEDVLGNTPRVLKSGKYDDAFYKKLWGTILRGDIYKDTLINKKKNGDIFYEKKTISPLKDDQNNLIGFVSSGKDVTLETMMHQEMEHLASIDKLTGIYNRHKFEELFSLEAERTRRFSSPLSLILLDIDHFKSVNDTYGHDIGDDVLKHFSSIIKSNIRQIDIFARWGGEEFLVLSPGTNLTEVGVFAEKLRLAIEKASFPTVNNVTVSVGLSEFEEGDTFSNLFKRADKALYFAKNNGRNQVSDHS
jgi:diguanylate cyclase (GGDEF)-like protein/PAS domain S-box-containing protein